MKTATVRKVLEATGIIKSEVGALVKIGARSTGVIDKMLVKVGDKVKAGDLIAVIDDREHQAQRLESEARLERIKSELKRVNTVYPLQLEEAEAMLDIAEAQRNYAQLNEDRQEILVDKQLAPQDTLDKARQDLSMVIGEVKKYRAVLNRLEEEFKRERIKAERAVAEAEASLNAINVRITYTRIKSPITGIVSQVNAYEGETVVSGLQVSNLITVLDPTKLEMWIYVDETDVGRTRMGLPVEFTVDAHPGMTFEGKIAQIYPEPEIRDNIVYYRAIVSLSTEHADQLRPEMTTHCSIIVQTRKDVLSIPNAALKWVRGEQVVFVRETGGMVREVRPEIGIQGLKRSEVLSGLAEGEEVGTQVELGSGSGGSGGSGSGNGKKGRK